ncbi:unnamed protein product [Clonostachys rhizophaga]|uniref:RNA polymerase II-associated protein 1 n=1 Tax=Clonostachys rhizophaga TaxID=160324 RepID=A0A9N9VR95_9HYPO|nr:unnamed protein product [Clonostachys rhizophaga]
MSSARSGERMIHQDFIARIRFSNALPPPPHPPKLLDIPNTGLASGQYTTPGFASRLAREQPLNIEVDAELGMPLDLVGMPGVFDGDESTIQAPSHQPAVHPHDRALLRPIAALGKKKVAEATVSFLRRTEYISNFASKRHDAGDPRALLNTSKKPRRAPEQAADSPAAIKRKIDRGFELAEEELKHPKRVRHPTKRNAQLLEAVPLIPDLDAFPDSGAFVTIKFATNPVASSTEYDKRLLSSLFRPIDRTEEEDRAYEAALEAHQQDPETYPKPQNLMNYEFFLPQSNSTGDKFRRKFDVQNPDRDNENLYTHQADGGGCFHFNRVREYETAQEIELDHGSKYSYEILLASCGDDDYPRQKAVYYYPVLQKSTIRPQRTKNIARTVGGGGGEDEQIVERLDVTVQDPNERMKDAMNRYKLNPLKWADEEEGEDQREASQDAEGEDRDAEGEEEDD